MAKAEKKKKKSPKIIFNVATVILIVGLAAFGGYYFYQYRQLKSKPVESAKAAQADEVKQILKAVGDKIELPKGEEPVVQKVEDKAKLLSQSKDAAFFANVQNGDVFIVYSKNKLAILYRPSTGKVVNVAPIAVSTTPTVTIIGEPDPRDAAEKTMNEKLKDKFKLVAKTDAKVQSAELLVVDLTGKNAEAAKQFAETLGGKVGTLPEGDDKPANSDIVVVTKTTVN